MKPIPTPVQIRIPIEVLQRIESWLITDIGYDRSMFYEEYQSIIDSYDSELEGALTDEEIKLYLKLTAKDNPSFTGDTYEDAITIGNNLVIPLWGLNNESLITDIKAIWNKYVTSPTEEDDDVFYGLLILTAIYYKHKATKGFFGLEPGCVFEIPSSPDKRKEMLELYILFNEESKTSKNTIDINYKNSSISLRNQDNWFTDMMQQYFKNHLVISNVEQAKRELEDFDPNYTNSKGKKPDRVYNSLLISVYNLIKHTTIKSEKALTDKEAIFILDYLIYLGIIEPESKRDDILNLRASIKNLQNFLPQWWNSALFA